MLIRAIISFITTPPLSLVNLVLYQLWVICCVTLLLLWSDLRVLFISDLLCTCWVCEIPPCLFSHTLLSLLSFLPSLLSPPSLSSSLTSDATQWSSSLAQTTATAVAITAAIDGTPARWWRRRNSGGGGDHTGYGWSDHCFCRAADGQTRDIGEDVSWRGRKKGERNRGREMVGGNYFGLC